MSAYDQGLPCKNPNCKSNGVPHGNCKCYGNLAFGGGVYDFCSSKQPHDSSCEYFAEGGLAGQEVPPEDMPEQTSLSGQEVPPEDMPAQPTQELAGKEVPPEDMPTGQDYSTTGQQLLTGVEGAAKGLAGPLATAAELGLHKAGIDSALGIDTSAEAQTGREHENQAISTGAEAAGLGLGLASGVGEAALLERGLASVAEHMLPEATNTLAKYGSTFFKGYLANALIQSGDEMSKALLGQGDQEAPVASALARINGAGLLGGAGGTAFHAIGSGTNKALQAIEDNKLGDKFKSFLAGMGEESGKNAIGAIPQTGNPIKDFSAKVQELKKLKENKMIEPKMYQLGKEFVTNLPKKMARYGSDLTASWLAHGTGIPGAEEVAPIFVDKVLGPYIEKLTGKLPASKLVGAVANQVLSTGETHGIWQAMNYAKQVAEGENLIKKGVGSLFKVSAPHVLEDFLSTDKEREKISDYVEGGGLQKELDQQEDMPILPPPAEYAEGGHVAAHQPSSAPQPHHNGIATHFPVQNMMLNTAKARVYNYLNGIRPQKPINKLAFDTHHEDHAAQREYKQALNIANKPLVVLKHIHDGTLTPSHVKHLTSMYPEIHKVVSKKITEHITNNQTKDEKPSYSTRLGLSLLLGQPLDSTMSPASIMAAQPVPTQPPQQAGGKMKGGKATTNSMLKTTKSYNLPNQAAELDRSSRD